MTKDGSPIQKHLLNMMLAQLVNAACDHYGIPRFLPLEIARFKGNKAVHMPLLKSNAGRTIWLDRDYIAVQLEDDVVRYLYVSQFHIGEELKSYNDLEKMREDPAKLPKEIAFQFKQAMKYIKYSNKKFYIFPEAEKIGLKWAEPFRSRQRYDVIRRKRELAGIKEDTTA